MYRLIFRGFEEVIKAKTEIIKGNRDNNNYFVEITRFT